MTPLKLLVTLGALAATSHAMAWDYVLLDTDKAPRNLHLTSEQLGVKTCLLYTSPSPRDS